jgi:PAS domain S-box-containing protein
VIVQRNGRFLFVNPAALRLCGAESIEQLQKKTVLDVIHPDDRAAIAMRMKQGQDGDSLPLWETRMVRLDGQIVPVEFVGGTVYYQGKRALQIIIRDVTERRRVEEKLRESEERFKVIASSTPDHLLVQDRELRYSLVVNPQLGLTEQDMIGKTDYDILSKDDADKLTKIKRHVLETGSSVRLEIPLISPKGKQQFFDGSYIPTLNAEGKINGLIGYFRNVTERKRTEERIAKLTRLNAALSRVNETIIRVRDVESLYHEVCRIVSEEGGFPLVWIGQVKEQQVVPAAWYGPASDYVKEIKVETKGELGQGPTGTSIRENRAVINDDFVTNPATSPWREPAGRYGFRASAAFPLRRQGRATASLTLYAFEPGVFDAEQVSLLESLSADISYALDTLDHEQLRVRAEDALRESERRLSEIIDFAPDATFAINKEGEVIAWNRAIEEMTGVQASDILGKGNYEYSLPFYGERRPILIDLAFSSEDEIKKKYHFVKKEEDILIAEADATLRGSIRVLWGKASLLHDNEGNITGAIESIRDITQRKQDEEELKIRTAQLEELNRELESFSYSVSHDLRAPLRAIDGYARLILKKQGDNFDEDTLNKFNVIRSSTHMMGQLIDDLLTFSRLSRKHISMSRLDMDALIRDAWKELEVINPDRSMRLTVKNIPAGCGDRALIKQVCINLLSNAVKFTKYRDAAHIEAGGSTDGDENVYFVKDNGVGFDMAYYDKLFGVFQRLHSSEDFEGTGVGLATVQRIIHRHGGRVWAEGKVDEGACFYFSLSRQEESIK